jgi:hypothetical protein
VKAHEYIRRRKFGGEILKSTTTLDEIRTEYLKNIRNRILRILVWVLKADNTAGVLLLPVARGLGNLHGRRGNSCSTMRQSIKRDTSYNQAYFQSLTLWYIMKHCRLALTPEFKSSVLLPQLKALSSAQEKKKYVEDRAPTAKSDILQWFRFRCVDLICLEALAEVGELGWYNESGLQTEIHNSMAVCEKFVSRLRESRQGPDSIIDEDIDRLYLLGKELFNFQTPGQSETPTDLAQARAREAEKRIEDRKPSSHFNPGPENENDLSPPLCHAPWELNCLNHHSALQAPIWSKDLVDLHNRRNNVFQFILSDHTFMTTWDRSSTSMIGQWWDIEPASVICATLIDLKILRECFLAILIRSEKLETHRSKVNWEP